MPLDDARKKELNKLHWDSKALLDTLADRLPADVLRRLRSASEGRDWTELVDGLCAELVQGHIEISSGERDAIAAVLDMFHTPKEDRYGYVNDPEGTLAALRVVD